MAERKHEDVPNKQLLKLQEQFHLTIKSRAESLLQKHPIDLPDFIKEKDALLSGQEGYIAIPGMYGGFSYHLRSGGEEPVLSTSSWCRVVGGSGQRHKVTCEGFELEEDGLF